MSFNGFCTFFLYFNVFGVEFSEFHSGQWLIIYERTRICRWYRSSLPLKSRHLWNTTTNPKISVWFVNLCHWYYFLLQNSTPVPSAWLTWMNVLVHHTFDHSSDKDRHMPIKSNECHDKVIGTNKNRFFFLSLDFLFFSFSKKIRNL